METARELLKRGVEAAVSTATRQPMLAAAVALAGLFLLVLLVRWSLLGGAARAKEGFQAAAGTVAPAMPPDPVANSTLVSLEVPGVTLSRSLCPSYKAFVERTKKDIATYTEEGAVSSLKAAEASLEATLKKMAALECDTYVPPPQPEQEGVAVPPPVVNVAPGTVVPP